MVKQTTSTNPDPTGKTDPIENQGVTNHLPPVNVRSRKSHHGDHEFRWEPTKRDGTAWCTCGRWTLENCSQDNGRRNHRHHLANLPSGRAGKGGQGELERAA